MSAGSVAILSRPAVSGAAAPETASSARAGFCDKFSIGIEGTLEPVSGRHTLRVSRHYRGRGWDGDFRLIRELGLDEVRYPIPWHEIERTPGRYRWRQTDQILRGAEERGVGILADPLHHTSYPRWLERGFLEPGFAAAYEAFVAAFAARYPGVKTFTPFNEPTCTLDFCGARGFWHPFGASDGSYVAMLRNTARATAGAVHAIRGLRPTARILHVDTFQRHVALDRESRRRSAFLNERRFVFEDLITGRVDRSHPLDAYLRRHGFGADGLRWHLANPLRIDERGGNYYPLNEEQLLRGATHHAPSHEPVGLAALAREYAGRVSAPLSLTETNIQGTARDRISWLKYILGECEALAESGLRLGRFAWYPLFDCAG